MPQIRMFRDRMVSTEQTLERGEKHLEFLKSLCKEIFPEFEYREHSLDHERDLFMMILEAPDGRRKTVGWTRMVLFDQERLPALLEDPSSPLFSKLRHYMQERASRPEIIVTFRHLEEGWLDTPEPRREKRRRRGRGRQAEKREGQLPASRPQPPVPPRQVPLSNRATPNQPPRPSERVRQSQPTGPAPGANVGEGRRRRRRFRRRRGRGGSGTAGSPPSPPGSGRTT